MQPLSWRSPPGQNPNIISTLIHVNRAFIMIMKVTSINDHHAVPVPIYLCNLGTLPTVIYCHCHHPNKSKHKKPPTKEKSSKSTGTNWMNAAPLFSFLFKRHSAFYKSCFPSFSFIISLIRSTSPTSLHWVEKGQICRLLQAIFNKGVSQPWRDDLQRYNMSPKVRCAST